MRTGFGRQRRSVDDLTDGHNEERASSLYLVTGHGDNVPVPMQIVGGEHGPARISNFRCMTPCKRCGGHSDDNGIPKGGLLPEFKCINETWYVLNAACPECCYGAWWKHFNPRMKFHDQFPEQVTSVHLQAVAMQVRAGRTLSDIIDNVTNDEAKSILAPIAKKMLDEEQLAF